MKSLWLFCLIILMLTCCNSQKYDKPVLVSVNIVDRNGMTETVSSKDRLEQYESVNFLSPQPYQKVLRVYERDKHGNINAVITNYHPNGQIKQYLEVVNNRAYGIYREWHPNGCMHIDTRVIGGTADINTGAEKTWLFDGISYAWNENGLIEAQIYYCRGELQGPSIYYHSNGNIWKRENYCNNALEGMTEVYLETGQLLQTTCYSVGKKHGPSYRYWDGSKIASLENFNQGRLQEGVYYAIDGQIVSQINSGEGTRAIFGKNCVSELQEYHQGLLDGEVRVLGKNGNLTRLLHLKGEIKDGEEIDYYESYHAVNQLQPKLSIMWSKGKIQGTVKSWYENGKLESQREMSENKKNGVLTAWYKDGSLMLIEDYDHDKLVKGEYYRKGDKSSLSQVSNGKGVAILFDGDGNPTRKVSYLLGKPNDS